MAQQAIFPTTTNYYSHLKPNFNEAINWICNQEEADKLSNILDEFVSSMKEKYVSGSAIIKNQTYILSNIPIKTANKHQGCCSWKWNSPQKKEKEIMICKFNSIIICLLHYCNDY